MEELQELKSAAPVPEEGRSIKKDNSELRALLADFYRHVFKKPLYWAPFLILSIAAYMPSFTMTKVQFEDFHRDYYLGSGSGMLSGRWGLVLWSRIISFAQANDVLEKYIGFVFMALCTVTIACIFYYLSHKSGRNILKYTFLSVGVATFPLINEIWSYNVTNFAATGNMLIGALGLLYLLVSGSAYWKKMLVVTVPLIVVSTSYECGLFAYVSLACVILMYRCIRDQEKLGALFRQGILFAIPAALSVVLGWIIGKGICYVYDLSYYRVGDTESHWAYDGALSSLIKETIDHYLARGLVYLPITVFVLAAAAFFVLCIYYAVKNRTWAVVLGGFVVMLSLFLQSLIQGSFLPYRTAQTLSIFVGFVFFLVSEWAEGRKKPLTAIVALALLFTCYRQSAFLNKINLLDQNIAADNAALVEQIGFTLTSEYNGKPVLFAGKPYVGIYSYSDYLYGQTAVGEDTLPARAYSRICVWLFGEAAVGNRYVDTNLNSTLFLLNVEPPAMEEYFSCYGYSIQVLNNTNLREDYPEVQAMLDSDSLHLLEFVDMGEYVVVKL